MIRARAVFGALVIGVLLAAPVVGVGALLGIADSDAWGVVTSVVFVAGAVITLGLTAGAQR